MKVGDGALQVEQCVQLDGCLGETKRRPVEQTQAQVDGGRIEGVDLARNVDFQPQRFVCVEAVGASNQDRSQGGPDAPVAALVGIGQCGAPYGIAQPDGVELGSVGAQRDLDIAQRLAPRQLRVGHDAKVLGTAQRADANVSRVACHDAREAGPRHILHHLRKQRLAGIHMQLPELSTPGNYSKRTFRVSNRHQTKSTANPHGYTLFLAHAPH